MGLKKQSEICFAGSQMLHLSLVMAGFIWAKL